MGPRDTKEKSCPGVTPPRRPTYMTHPLLLLCRIAWVKIASHRITSNRRRLVRQLAVQTKLGACSLLSPVQCSHVEMDLAFFAFTFGFGFVQSASHTCIHAATLLLLLLHSLSLSTQQLHTCEHIHGLWITHTHRSMHANHCSSLSRHAPLTGTGVHQVLKYVAPSWSGLIKLEPHSRFIQPQVHTHTHIHTHKPTHNQQARGQQSLCILGVATRLASMASDKLSSAHMAPSTGLRLHIIPRRQSAYMYQKYSGTHLPRYNTTLQIAHRLRCLWQ